MAHRFTALFRSATRSSLAPKFQLPSSFPIYHDFATNTKSNVSVASPNTSVGTPNDVGKTAQPAPLDTQVKRQPKSAPETNAVPPASFTPKKPVLYSFNNTSTNPELSDLMKRTDNLVKEVLSANWSDYWTLVMDSPIWIAESERIFEAVQPYLHDEVMASKMTYLNRLLEILDKVEQIRDDINEVIEQTSRSSGIAGTGLFAHEKVSNVDEHASAAAQQYDLLLRDYSEFRPQIEEVVGYALALLRQKQRYNWSTMHAYFY